MGPRSTNQPSILIRIVGLISVLATVVAIYYLIGDSDVADNIDGTQYGRHPSHGPILQPIEISQPSSHLPLTSYTCMPSANLSHIPTTQPLMGLPFPLPKYFHQHGHSIAVRLALTAPYSLVLDLTRQEISNSTKSLVNTASRRFCLAQKAPSSRVDAYYHDVGTIKVILSSAAMLDVAAKSSLSKKLLRKVQHPEAYCLLIKEDNRAIVIAHNERGAMLALETLSQLLHSPMGLQVPTEIIDWPENSWRGQLRSTLLCSRLFPSRKRPFAASWMCVCIVHPNSLFPLVVQDCSSTLHGTSSRSQFCIESSMACRRPSSTLCTCT